MKKTGFIVLLTIVLIGGLFAEEIFFPNDDFIIRLPLKGDWENVQSREIGTYTVYSTRMDDIELVLYFTGDVIAPLQHMDLFLKGSSPFNSDTLIDRENTAFAIYTKQVFDMYLAEMYSYYALSGVRSVDGQQRYFFTRIFFPDYYGIVVMASVPVDKQEEYKHKLKALLDF